MSAEVGILARCLCRNKLKVETDFVDEDINLVVYPCSQCLKEVLKGRIWFVLHADFVPITQEGMEMLGIGDNDEH